MSTTISRGTSPAIVTPISRPARIALLGAGAAAIAMALYQVGSPGSPEANYQNVWDFVREGLTLAYLVLSMLAVRIAWRADVVGRVPALMIIGGYGLIAIGVAVGLVMRSDPDWFFLLGGPGNLAAGIGFVVGAVTIWRRHVLPRWAAVLCGVGGFFAILLAELGTTVLIGAFWIVLESRLPRASHRA